MKNRDLIQQLSLYPDDEVVMAINDENVGPMESVVEVVYEPTSHDDGGNPTSTGGTIWLKTQEY